jgi:branched-chain amino acid aminotransferase
MSTQIYIDGRYFETKDAKISVFDHGLLFGDGVFEGIRCYGGQPFRLEQHLRRLFDSAKAIFLRIPISQDELAAAVVNTLAVNNIKDGYVRLLVTRGSEVSGALVPGVTCMPGEAVPRLDFDHGSEPSIIIIADQITLYPEEFYKHGLDIVTAKTRRNHPSALNPRIKSLNYLGNIMAKIEGLEAGVTEAVMLNYRDEVAECTAANVFIVRDEVLRTPPITAGILEGVTRAVILELASELGIKSEESTLTTDDLYDADECFVTGTGAEVIPVVRIDGKPIGSGKPGRVTSNLLRQFRLLTRR